MSENNKTQPNWPLLLPIGLLVVEIIVVAVMRLAGFTISQYLFYFFIILGVYLIYQIGKQLIAQIRVRSALNKLAEAKQLADSGQSFEAIKEWKKLLLQLPREKYLEVLSLLEETFLQLEMPKAVQQTRNIQSESVEFFEATKQTQRVTNQDRQDWQMRANEIRNMINDLPETKN